MWDHHRVLNFDLRLKQGFLKTNLNGDKIYRNLMLSQKHNTKISVYEAPQYLVPY